MQSFDAAVLGLGVLGGAILHALARRGAPAAGFDCFAPPHERGSSHGGSRITREAIGEGAHLTPLARRSQALWREIEMASGKNLLTVTGLLIVSSPERTGFTHVDNFFATTVAAARKHGIPHELLDTAQIRRRFPQFHIGDGEHGYFEPGAGFLRPEACVAEQLELAKLAGAEIHLGEPILSVEPGAGEVVFSTAQSTYSARTLIISAGAWIPGLLPPHLARHFRVYRQVQCWFAPRNDEFRPGQFPVFIWELRGRSQSIYGFPDIDGLGVKVATEQYEGATDAEKVTRHVEAAERQSLYAEYVKPFLPGLSSTCTRSSVCLYTVTPDFGFVVDRHPASERVLIASCCSGHGFKHAPALGEAIAEQVLEGSTRIDLRPFALSRFSVHG